MEMEIRQEERCRLHGASWEHCTGKRYLHIGETKKDFTSRKAGPPPWLESGEPLKTQQQLNRDMEPPHYSLTHEGKHKKILELANKMIELLSGEVPIRCQDVSVYFSMEEWDYIEGHKDQYQDLMMEEHQNLMSTDDRSNKTRLHTGESGSDWESLRTTCRGEDLQVARQGITEDDERKVSVKEVKSCSEGAKDVKKSNYKYRSTDPAKQYSHVYIEEEPFPPEGEIHRETPYRPTDHTYCVPFHIKPEPLSCGEERPLDTSAGNAQHHPTTYIEEDPVLHGAVDLTDLTFDLPIDFAQLQPPTYVEKPISREGVDLTDPNTDSPLYHARHQQSFDVKEEPVLYNGEDITDPKIDELIEQTQPQPSAHIKEEPVLYNGEDITDPNTDTHIEQTEPQRSAHIKEEPVLYNGEDITDPNTDTHIEQTQPQRSAHIMEEPVLYNGEDITDPNTDTHIEQTQPQPSAHIKEEPDLYNGEDITDPKIDELIEQTQPQQSAHIKEEPVLYNGEDITDPNTDAHIEQTEPQRSAHIKEEPVLYNGEDITDPNTDTHIEQTQPQRSAHIMEEPVLYNGEDITDPNTDTHIEQTQPQRSAHIMEEPVLYNGEDITDPNTDAHIEQTQPQQSAHIKEEPVLCHEKNTEPNLKLISWVRGNLPDLNTHTPSHLQSSSTLEEPVTNEAPKMEYTMVLSEEDRKHVLDRTNDCIPKSPVQQCPSTQIIGLTDERPSNPSLVRSVVMAHLLEMAQSKKGLINDINSYSQSQLCPPNTTTISMESDVESLTKKVKAEKSFGDISNLTKYLRVNSKKKTPQCLQCGQYFLRKSQLEAHVQVHVKKTSFECMGDQLGEHPEPQAPSNLLKVNEEEKPFQCTECSECFSIYYELYEHKKTHSEDKKYQGPKCGKCYNSQAQCDGHPRTDARKSSYGCNGCGRLFLDREKLLTHQNLHTGRNPYECPDCGKRFEYRSDLIVHRRTHNEHKPAVCYQCGKSFSTHSSLTQHIVTHAKPTQCSFSDLEERSQTDSKECHLVSRVGSEGSAVKTWVVKDGKNTIVENKVTS
ncbi:uncharacterized protein [Engystomops pustulosus]|uniref:uncharacterized protein isoform X2 n=1 Tax=Engystomops pustulosus TaxID=76066 RepID=UPI003AFA3E9A